MLDINGEAAEAVAAEIGGVGFAVDVGDADGLRQVVNSAVATLGGLSIPLQQRRNRGLQTASRTGIWPNGTGSSGST